MIYTNMKSAMQYSTEGVNNDYVLYERLFTTTYYLQLPTKKYYLQLPKYRHTT